jgi:hypothetical protein
MLGNLQVRFGGGRMEKDAVGSPRAEELRHKTYLASRLPYTNDDFQDVMCRVDNVQLVLEP